MYIYIYLHIHIHKVCIYIYRHRYMVMVSIDQQTHQEAGKLAVTATEMLSSMEVTASRTLRLEVDETVVR